MTKKLQRMLRQFFPKRIIFAILLFYVHPTFAHSKHSANHELINHNHKQKVVTHHTVKKVKTHTVANAQNKSQHSSVIHKKIHHVAKLKHAHKKIITSELDNQHDVAFVASPAELPTQQFTSNASSDSLTLPESTVDSSSSSSFLSSTGMFPRVGKDVVKFVHTTVDHLRYSIYKLGGSHFDTNRGVYIVDCSNFVDHILQHVSPHAYSSLVSATGAESPASQQYYNFFKELSAEDNNYWNKVENVENLLPGDILVFRYKNARGNQTGGHVMVVMDKPIGNNDSYLVKVADSASSRHSNDTRQYNESGIGIGTLLLKANHATGRPQAYAWAQNSYWHNNVTFAMARPVSLH